MPVRPEPHEPALHERLARALRDVPDFPKPGIRFKDITPLLRDPALFRAATAAMAAPYEGEGITQVVGVESRGFILGAPIAQQLGAGFVPFRKPGKLPWTCERVEYASEYGTDVLEGHADAVRGERVLVVDDVLATGGTAAAAVQLVGALCGTVAGCAFLLHIAALGGAARLGGTRWRALIAG